MAIEIKGHRISNIVVSSIGGHSGGGMFPFKPFYPPYSRFMQTAREIGITSLTKSSTAFAHQGNFIPHNPLTWGCVRKLGENGMLNSYNLTNDGVMANAQAISRAQEAGFKAIPNFYPQFADGLDISIDRTLMAIGIYQRFLGNNFRTLELNFSCPNAREEIEANTISSLYCARAVKLHFPSLSLIAKISIVHPHEFVQELERAGVDVIHSINTIPYNLVYKNGPPSPLAKYGGGGVSGGPAKTQAYLYNRLLRPKIKIPIIMGCGVTSVYDAESYFDIGANAVSICTVVRRNPKEAIKIIKHNYRTK